MTPSNTPSPQSIGSTPPPPKSGRLGDKLMSQLGALLSKALADAASLEVRTFTNEAADSELVSPDDPLAAGARLRAFTRISMDGDTQQSIPLLASGEPDDVVWKLHCAAVAQAREDRAQTVASVVSMLEDLTGR